MFKYGLIMQNTRENGEKIKPMVEESSGMPTVIFTRVNGKTTKPMDMVFISTSMVPNTKDTGKMIFKMDKVWNLGKMEVDMREAIRKE